MATGKLSKKELYRPPSYGELKSLEFAEKQLNNHLFSLQIEELLQEVSVTVEARRSVDAFVQKLTYFLTSLPASGSTSSLQELMAYIENDDDVKIPFPRDLISSVALKGSYRFLPPQKAFACGAWKLDCTVDKNVDIAVVMPSESMHEKDYLNYRCFLKRAIFLRHVVSRLLDQKNKEDSLIGKLTDVSFTFVDGNVLWPAVLLKSTENVVKSFTIRLIPFFDRTTLKLNRFSNEVSNVRLDDCLAISLVYNQSSLADLTMEDTRNRIESAFGLRSQGEGGPYLGLLNGLKLLKIWSKQRQGLLWAGAGLGGYFWCVVMLHLLNIKRLNTMMTPMQVFKITLQSLGDKDFGTKGPLSILTTQKAALSEAAAVDWSPFDVVLTDSSGFHNFTYHMSASQLEKLKVLAIETVTSLESFDRFDATFLASLKPTDFYDQVWAFRLENVENISDSVSPKTIDAVVEAKRLILERLNRGIGRRLRCIDFIEDLTSKRGALTFGLKTCAPDCLISKSKCLDLRIGVCFNSETCMDVIDKGPAADTPDAAKFRSFWMKKSELRRFQDGSILEAVVWDENWEKNPKDNVPAAERTLQSRRLISFQAACWILENHCGIGRETLFCSEMSLSRILTPLLRKFPPKSYGSGEELFLNFTAAYERLTKMLKTVERTMALGFQSVQGVGASFRFTEVFPPLPCSFDQSMADVVNNSRFPNAQKICPPYILPNDVVVMLEGGGAAWPDDWSAFRRVRAALHVQLFLTIGDEWPEMPRQANTNWVDVVVDGFVFRLKLRCNHEVNILRTQKDPSSGKTSLLETGAIKLAEQLANEIQAKPKLTAILHAIASGQSFAYSGTCRLVKRWLSSQMFTSHISDDVIDVMVAQIFICPSTVPCPVSPLAGFLRFLKLFATHDWRLNPLIVNLNNEFTHDRLNELMLDFAKNRTSYPAFSVISPVDPTSEWTRDSPSVVVLNRLLILAAKSYDRLSWIVLRRLPTSPNDCSNDIASLFTPDFSVFDIVLELDHKFLSRRHESLTLHRPGSSPDDSGVYLPKFKEKKSVSAGSAGAVIVASKKFPVVDFDMQEKLYHELKSAYGEIALFFYDRYGGSKIGVVWKPTGEREFKLQNMNISQPTVSADAGKAGSKGSGEEVCLTTNQAAALADFRFIGQGIIVDVVTNSNITSANNVVVDSKN